MSKAIKIQVLPVHADDVQGMTLFFENQGMRFTTHLQEEYIVIEIDKVPAIFGENFDENDWCLLRAGNIGVTLYYANPKSKGGLEDGSVFIPMSNIIAIHEVTSRTSD